MESPTPKQLTRLVDRYLNPQKKWDAKLDAQMREGLRQSEAGRAYYNERVIAHRLMVSGDGETPSGFESERMLHALLEGAAPSQTVERAFWVRFGSMLAGAAAVLAVAIQFPAQTDETSTGATSELVDGQRAQGEYIGARGTENKELPAGLGISGVPIAGDVAYEIVASQGIKHSDSIRLSYRNADPRLGHLFVFAMQEGGEILWYLPIPAERQSASIKVGKESLFDISLSDSHKTGKLRVFALFTRWPVALTDVKRAAEGVTMLMSEDRSLVTGKLYHALDLDLQTDVVTVLDTTILGDDGIRAGE